MRYLKKFLLVGFITSILILSFSMSASAVDVPNYDFGTDYGIITGPVSGYDWTVGIFYKNSADNPFFIKFCVNCYFDSAFTNKVPNGQYAVFPALKDDGGLRCVINNRSGSNIYGELFYYLYDGSGVLVKSGSIFGFGSGTSLRYVANNGGYYTTTSFSSSSYSNGSLSAFALYSPFYVGTATYAPNSINSTLVQNTTYNFTVNSNVIDEEGNIGGGTDDDSGGSCNCIDYTSLLQLLLDNQSTQIQKLNQIITILQNSNNDDIVDAVNDAVDDIINSSPGSSPPAALDPDDFPDKESDLLGDLPGIDDDDVDSVSDHVSLDSDAIAWWYERFTDVTSNTKFRAVMLTMLSLAVIGFVLNKRGVL